MRNLGIFFLTILLSLSACNNSGKVASSSQNKVIIAYVTSWSMPIPAPGEVTHINYAFAHVTDSFDGVRIDNEERLRAVVELKNQQPDLKVLLSIGGWGSGKFSEMAATDANRKSFAADCQRIVKEFNLDGIDIDWEYPTSDMAGISAAPEDLVNNSLLMIEIRKAIGKKKLLTLATASNAKYYDFKGFVDYVDYVNIMSYDMGWPPYHNAGVFPSEMTQYSSHESVTAHIDSGVPRSKIVFGIPFYGHFDRAVSRELFRDTSLFRNMESRFEKKWDEKALVPYLVNDTGRVIYVFEDSLSISLKGKYIMENDLPGAMFWEYSSDRDGSLLKALKKELEK